MTSTRGRICRILSWLAAIQRSLLARLVVLGQRVRSSGSDQGPRRFVGSCLTPRRGHPSRFLPLSVFPSAERVSVSFPPWSQTIVTSFFARSHFPLTLGSSARPS